MGQHFGELIKLRGIVFYRISPYEQKALAGLFSKGFPNLIRRVREEIFYVVPPFIGSYLYYDYLVKKHKRINRKNPADYEHEE